MIFLQNDPSLALMKDEVLAAELLEFCERDLFPETLQNSDVASSSNCYDENLSYAASANLSFPSDVDIKYSSEPLESTEFQNHPNENGTSSSTFAATTTEAIIDNNTLSVILDELDNTISSSIDFSTSPPYTYLTITHQDQLDFSSGQLTGIAVNGLSVSQYPSDPVISLMAPTISSVYQENCLSMMPPFLLLNPSASSSSYTFLDPSMDSLPGTLNATLAKTILVGSQAQTKEPEYFGPDQLQRVQNLSNDKQQLVNGAVSTPMSTEILTLEDSAFKAGKLSVEERKEKIHRYLKKRNERNFNKKIKYACRKTLADSRPRVRGRFARNDYFGDTTRSQYEEYDYDQVRVPVKEEDDLVSSSDIFAHISGVNSFKCGQSWI